LVSLYTILHSQIDVIEHIINSDRVYTLNSYDFTK